jgi:mono/diheme cytochrome c family protein
VSTANSVPLREDLHAVLLRGMPGSSMPPWGHLSQQDRDALVDELMRLRSLGAREAYVTLLKDVEEYTDEELAAADVQAEIADYVKRFTTPGETSAVPEIPPISEEMLAVGREAYAKFACIQCHGNEGKGDGVQQMFDDEKLPTRPRDFTAGVFKGGHDPASLYRRIAYGMPGTPMPGSTQMTPEQMIALVHNIRSMSAEQQRQAAILIREKILVVRADSLPESGDAAAWNDVPAVGIRMTPLWWRDGADPDLRVQAAHDGESMAVRISWRDETHDAHAARSESFEDAVAMELFAGVDAPFIGMGAKGAPVDVWFWDADRQSPEFTVENEYPRVVADLYPFSEMVVDTAEYDRPGTKLSAQPPLSLPALASGNQIVPGGAAGGGSDLAGGGPGSVTFRMPRSELVTAEGQWTDTGWTVVMTRSLAVDSEDAGVSLKPGDKASAAFAVWDGAEQDRDGKKLITIWQDLELEP